MLNKIKVYIMAIMAIIAAIFAFLFQRANSSRKAKAAELDKSKALLKAGADKDQAQTEINAVIKEKLKPGRKQKNKPGKILLPIIIAFFIISCSKYPALSPAPELFIFETGVEMVLENGKYCVDFDGAMLIKTALESYKKEIDIYEEWRNHGK